MPARRTDVSALHAPLLAWFARSARELPWRGGTAGGARTDPAGEGSNDSGLGWAVLVSEVMLQQTPVPRVVPVFGAWMTRWATPTALAADAPGEAVRMWGRLGYPLRALRLHGAATLCVQRFGGRVPSAVADLRTLPGVGEYTAAAVASFAYGGRSAVLDTNVRRVLARVVGGTAYQPAGGTNAAERRRAESLLPAGAATAARWNAAVMELGALVCTARAPDCGRCPLANACRWHLAGHPAWEGPPRRAQTYDGTDRQVRGRLLAAVRDADGPVGSDLLDATWPDADQRARALDSLVSDGLVEPLAGLRYRLPR